MNRGKPPAEMATGTATGRGFSSFTEFWPHYVREHRTPLNRRLHFIGTALLLPVIWLAATATPWFVLLLPVTGYGFAWIGHFFVEKNKPATFIHPWWSLIGDFRMFGLMLVGRMDDEVRRCLAIE